MKLFFEKPEVEEGADEITIFSPQENELSLGSVVLTEKQQDLYDKGLLNATGVSPKESGGFSLIYEKFQEGNLLEEPEEEEPEEEQAEEPEEDLQQYKDKVLYDAFTKKIEDFVYALYSEKKQGQDVMWLAYYQTLENPSEYDSEKAGKIVSRMKWARETIEAFKNGEAPEKFPS